MNYSRSFWFDFLPFYHMGVRASYPVNDHFALNYWLVNGTNQVEPPTGSKTSCLVSLRRRVKRSAGR